MEEGEEGEAARALMSLAWLCAVISTRQIHIVRFRMYTAGKKKILQACAPDFNTNAEGVGCWKELPFTTSAGPCTVKSIKNGVVG